MTAELQRSIGRMEGRLDGIEVTMEKIGDQIADGNMRLTNIEHMLSEKRGRQKLLITIGSVAGGIAGALGALVVKALPYFTGK